jgi:hypothetical protein
VRVRNGNSISVDVTEGTIKTIRTTHVSAQFWPLFSEHDMVPYIRKSPVKLVKHAALVKSGGLLEKRSGISSIVRYVESSVSEISVFFD